MKQTALSGSMPKQNILSKLSKENKKKVIDTIAGLLILLFTYASASKLYNIHIFYFEINNQPLPNWLTPYLMTALVGMEIGLSIMLIFEKTRKKGIVGSLIVMIIFTIYVLVVLAKLFPYVPCSCGGFIRELTWSQHLAFNLFFILISALALKLYGTDNKTLR